MRAHRACTELGIQASNLSVARVSDPCSGASAQNQSKSSHLTHRREIRLGVELRGDPNSSRFSLLLVIESRCDRVQSHVLHLGSGWTLLHGPSLRKAYVLAGARYPCYGTEGNNSLCASSCALRFRISRGATFAMQRPIVS